jgi:DNA-binding beta-propeller fold protein YncE
VSLNASTGELSGTPTVFGTFNFTVTAVDSSSPAQMAMQALSLLVAESATPGMIVTFVVQPSTSSAGSVISPPVRVQVIDSFGAVVPGANVDMTIGFDPTSGSGVLAGTTMVLTDALGQATFSDLSLTPAGNGYRLRASVSAGGFLPAQADSAAFDVVPPTMPGTEHLLLADRTPSLVRRFDLNVDTELSASTRTGTNPDDVAVSPNGRLAFVANLNSNFISLLDLTLNTELARLRSLRAFHAQLTADGARLVVPMVARPNSDEVVIVDTATLDEQRISLNGLVGDDPDFGSDITLGALVVVGNRTFIEGLNSAVPIIILNLDTATVSTIPGTDSSSGFVPSQGTPSLAATPDGSLVVAVRASPNNLLIIDTTSGSESVLQTVALGSFPRAVAVTRDAADPDGVFAFVLRSPNIISAVSLNPGPTFGTIVSEVTLPVEMGNVTFGLGVLALTADSNRAFVINGSPASTHNLAVVDIVGGGPTFSVVKSLRVGSELRDVTVAPTLLASPPGAPTVTDVSPSQVVNTSDTVIEITGSGFDPDAHVRLGNLDPVPATFLSSSLLQVTLPALSAAQRADVLVINPNSTGSQSDQFLSGRLADALEISSSSAFRPRHQVAVVNFGESTVSVLNAAVNDTLHATNPETELLGVTFTPDAARAYVGQFSDPGAVRGFNLLTGALEATIPVSTNTIGQSQGVASALHPTLGTPVVYVVSGIPLGGGMGFDEQLSVIDADPTSSNFNTVIQTIAAGLTGGAGNRGGLAVTPDGRYVYHNGFVSGDGRIVIFDVVTETATAVLTSSLGVGTFQPFVRLSPDGQSLLLRDNDGAVRVFDIGADPFNPTLVATIVGTPPMGFDSVFFCDFQVVDNHLFADDCGPHLVQVFNFDRSTPDFSQIASFDAPGLDGFFFSGITVTPDGGHLYIVLDQEDSIAVLDTAQLISAGPGVLLTKIRVGLNASTLAARPGTPTPGGSDVTVQMTQDVSVIFSSVTGSGETSVAVSGAHPIALPSGFNPGLPPLFYEVNTTAAFSGTLQVCITYVEGQFSTAEGSLRILHQEGAVWVDRTFSLDTANNVICARVTSLSAFVVGGP